MRLPTIQGVIDRRILVNYRVDAGVAARLLPAPFRPKLANGYAMAGICLIRLKQIRPAFVPLAAGVGSENAAHRFAVEWDRDGQRQEGVFIPRRDTSSRLNTLVGGRLFPGEHHHARFEVSETEDRLRVEFESDDGQVRVSVAARLADGLPPGSVFASVDEASRFFEGGALGYSATQDPARYDGLELRCKTWAVQPLAVEAVRSSYFDDRRKFPEGSATFDCALLMRGIEHEWHTREDLYGGERAGV
ncbi:MAG TPA: DUF2071 domain-containing protein [Tepidisphaeraceae bacterium]